MTVNTIDIIRKKYSVLINNPKTKIAIITPCQRLLEISVNTCLIQTICRGELREELRLGRLKSGVQRLRASLL